MTDKIDEYLARQNFSGAVSVYRKDEPCYQKAAGYRDWMKKNVFDPLEMTASGFFAFNCLPENTAWGYMNQEENLVTNIYQLPIRGGGDGGLYTNSPDMHSFWTNLFRGKLLSKKYLEIMTTPDGEIFQDQKYGLGIYISDFQGHTQYSALGCDCGVGFSSAYIPDMELNINVFSNLTGGDMNIMKYLLDLMH